jgi:hypothetical protein
MLDIEYLCILSLTDEVEVLLNVGGESSLDVLDAPVATKGHLAWTRVVLGDGMLYRLLRLPSKDFVAVVQTP